MALTIDQLIAQLEFFRQSANDVGSLTVTTCCPSRHGQRAYADVECDDRLIAKVVGRDAADPRGYEWNARYIVTAVNAIPVLIAEIRRLRGSAPAE